jgi:competence protein ComEA
VRLSSSRRVDDADLIRARLRVLLDEGRPGGGWLPEDLPEGPPASGGAEVAGPRVREAPVDDEPEEDDALPAGLGRHRAPGPAVRLAPRQSSARALLLAAVLGAVVLVGWTWLDRPRAEPVDEGPAAVTASPPAPATPAVGPAADAAETVTVSVVGQVARPGLVVLPEGARTADALAAAGGLLPGADPAAVNLAAVVTDGQQIAIGVPGAAGGAAAAAPAAAGGRVPLNSATVSDLDALPGIGPVLAQRIVDHRAQNGPFTAVEQLDDVPGIGPAIYDELADLVTV